MIRDPKHERYYRDDNDRMPAFAEHPDDAAENRLESHTIEILADWLRGNWYEPPPAEAGNAPAEKDE